ncbi:hypothetical protein Psi02_42280 [Planotetraspora silvatica]|uniref:Uncharacterized protein n=1 Tax=Planotetraspora silvatica TaxID=234614 RepID=A0A8J3USY3_9ACTN|nr:hypothetical protein [Planotetraspora silvatica]GII47804.1 hypothetical protein Psi02_42280 [Planotetraspora silvatica]
MSNHLPHYLPAWQGVDQIAQGLDVDALRATARELVDLVLTEDDVYLDALPDTVETSLVTPLGILASVLEGPSTFVELVVAARLVRKSAPIAQCPPELVALIRQLPE